MEFIGSEKLVDFDSYHDLECDKADGTVFDVKEYATMPEEGGLMDDDYKRFKNLLLCILTEKSKTKPLKKRKEKVDDGNVHELDSDCYIDEEANDPHYGLFLKSLRAHEKSYVVKDERNGVPFVVKYEGDESSDKECDLEYKRKLRSAKKQNNGPSKKCKHDSQSTSSSKEAVNLSRRKLRNRAARSEKVENVADDIVTDPDYNTFLKTFKVVEDHNVLEYGADTVVYELSDGERNHEREEEEEDDDWADDVKILDSTLFYKEGNLNPSMAVANDVLQNSEFRRQLMAVLTKPYDKEEYEKLWFDIEVRKPEERHIELRHGRERSHSTNKCGKSYLDFHPDLRRQLSRFHDDKPKCLNLLRGFFFWLKKASHNGSFQPWLDAECLVIH